MTTDARVGVNELRHDCRTLRNESEDAAVWQPMRRFQCSICKKTMIWPQHSDATADGAALLGMEKNLGAVAPGYYADIVAVEGDPRADIGVVVHGVRWVMKGGSVVVDRTTEPAKK